MKHLLIVRHAKSSWDNPSLDDFYRPLNTRGAKDAEKMAEFVKRKGVEIDFFLSSPAERAFATAKTFAKTLGYPVDKIKQNRSLYNFSDDGSLILSEIKKCSEEMNSVAIFGHNDTFFSLVNRLSKGKIDRFSTCSVAFAKFDLQNWSKIGFSNCEIEFFASPKTIQ